MMARAGATNTATSFPILTFHAVDDRPSVISFSPRLFDRGMARLHGTGYRTLSLLELADCLRRGVAFPERSLALTFDDGYRSVYDHVFPVLQRYGFSATVFLTVGGKGNGIDSDRLPSMSDRTMLSWGEIREMRRYGIEFGAHTLTHPDLTRLPGKLAEIEICESKATIENALSAPAASFAYPYGRYDMWCREVVSEQFLCACSDRLDLVTQHSDRFTIERLDAYYLRAEWLFACMASTFFPLYVKARAIPRRLRRGVTELCREGPGSLMAA